MKGIGTFIVLVSALLLACAAWAVAQEGEFLVRFTTSADTFRELPRDIRIVRTFGASYLALADLEDLNELHFHGAVYEVLDRDPLSGDYYVVFLLNTEEIARVGSLAHVLLAEELMVLVRATPREAEDLKNLERRVEKLSLDPIKLVGDPSIPPPTPSVSSQAVSDPATSTQASAAFTPDPLIMEMVGSVSTSSLQTLVSDLVTNSGHGTRRADTAGGVAAAEYIHDAFASYGISGANLDYEDIDEGSDVFSDNVIAEIPGTVNPEDIIILGAHYDSVCGYWSGPCNGDPNSSAPGADDNATGTAAVLEAARILNQYEFENTIRFVAFSAEEFVLVGSQYHADEAAIRGDNIVAMVNIDMIGYVASGDDPDVDIIVQDDPGTQDDDTVAEADAFRGQAFDAIDTYVPGFGRIPEWAGSGWGATTDHRPFHRKGWPAIWFFEDKATYSPYIHTASDTVGPSLNDWDFMTDCTRSIVATLATFAVPVDDTCTDNDSDGYYWQTGCGTPSDCNDTDEKIYPTNPNTYCDCEAPYPQGAAEICSGGVDEDCDGWVDIADPECQGYSSSANAEASTYGSESLARSGTFNELALLLIPAGVVLFMRILRRKSGNNAP